MSERFRVDSAQMITNDRNQGSTFTRDDVRGTASRIRLRSRTLLAGELGDRTRRHRMRLVGIFTALRPSTSPSCHISIVVAWRILTFWRSGTTPRLGSGG